MYLVKDGKVYSGYIADFIENPAIWVDGDVVLGVGEYNYLLPKYKILRSSFKDSKLDISGMYLLPLLNRLNEEDACYVMNVFLSYTSSGFAKEFANKYYSNDLLEWLNKEKKIKVV